MYSLWVDDLATGRDRARDALDEALAEPLGPKAGKSQLARDDPEWGLTPDAVAAAEQADQYFPFEEESP